MTWNPSEKRAPSGVTEGGQWVSAAAAKKAAAKKGNATPKKAGASSKSSSTKTSAPKLGKARDANAAKVQQDKQAQKLYEQAMGMDSAQRAAFMKKLPPDQLEKLTAILYSFPTSDKSIVAARIAVANEMTKRGIDIKKYGALGGGIASHAGHASHSVAAHRVLAKVAMRRPSSGSSAAASAAKAAALARSTSQVRSTFSNRAE